MYFCWELGLLPFRTCCEASCHDFWERWILDYDCGFVSQHVNFLFLGMHCVTCTEVFACSLKSKKSSIASLFRAMWSCNNLKMLSHRWMNATGHPDVSPVTEMPDWSCIVTVDPAQFIGFGWVLRLPPQRATQVDLLCIFSMLKIPHETDGK